MSLASVHKSDLTPGTRVKGTAPKEQVSRDESVVTPTYINELEILTREMVDPYPTPFLLSLFLKEISFSWTQFSLTHLHVGCLSR